MMGLCYREHQKYEMQTWLKQYPHQKPVLIPARHIQTYCHSLTWMIKVPFPPPLLVIMDTVYNIVVWLHSGKRIVRFKETSRRWGSKSTWIRNWLVTLGVRRDATSSLLGDSCVCVTFAFSIECCVTSSVKTRPKMTQTALNCRHINTWCVSLYSHMWQNISFCHAIPPGG